MTGGTLDVLIHNAARMEAANMFRGLTDLYVLVSLPPCHGRC